MTITEGINEIGYCAATLDVMAADPTITDRERAKLISRAAQYRAEQITLLDQIQSGALVELAAK